MGQWLANPKLFNVVILVLFALAAARWTVAGNAKQAVYWAGAFILNFAITYLPE